MSLSRAGDGYSLMLSGQRPLQHHCQTASLCTSPVNDAIEIGMLLAVKEYRRTCFVGGLHIRDYRTKS